MRWRQRELGVVKGMKGSASDIHSAPPQYTLAKTGVPRRCTAYRKRARSAPHDSRLCWVQGPCGKASSNINIFPKKNCYNPSWAHTDRETHDQTSDALAIGLFMCSQGMYVIAPGQMHRIRGKNVDDTSDTYIWRRGPMSSPSQHATFHPN